MRRRRSRKRPEEVAALLECFDSCGLSPYEFAQAEGMAVSTLHRWLRRRELARASADAMAFVPVEVRDPPLALTLAPSAGHLRVELACGRTLCIPAGFPPHALQELLPVLEGQC